MAGLTMIERDLYDAAKVDGATPWQRFVHVTFPSLRPVFTILLIYHALVALTNYDLVYAMTARAQDRNTLLSFRIWQESFSMMNFGTAPRSPSSWCCCRSLSWPRSSRRCRPTCCRGAPETMRQLRSVLSHLAALLLLLVCAGPIALSLFASVMPDQAIFISARLVRLQRDLGQLSLHLHRPAPGRLSHRRRQPRHDLGRGAPGAGKHVEQFGRCLGRDGRQHRPRRARGLRLARFRFRGQTVSFLLIIMSRLVPAVALVVPFYLIVQGVGLLGTKLALVLIHSILTLPFTVLILTVFFRRIPREIADSAMLDGCGRLEAFRYVFLPLARTSVIATGLFAFVLSYSELFALVLPAMRPTGRSRWSRRARAQRRRVLGSAERQRGPGRDPDGSRRVRLALRGRGACSRAGSRPDRRRGELVRATRSWEDERAKSCGLALRRSSAYHRDRGAKRGGMR